MRAGGPRAPSSVLRLFGVYYGVVTQNKDPDGKCRVKVRLPWLDKGDQDQTHWAQIATPMAGSQYGWYTIPDVDDVVALMFIAGDVAHPVVLGGIWSKTDKPPEDNSSEKNEFRGYKSRAGSRVVFDDSDKTKVYLSDKTDKNAVSIGSLEGGSSGPNKRAGEEAPAVGSGAKQGVSIASMEGELQITAKGKLKVDAQNIEIISKGNVDIKATGTADLKGANANLEGGSSAKFEGAKASIN